ncbi:MAG TPA: DNA primase [Fimbriimonadaceae bacterium]|nr:DNA primase [Fimbriimonadaceae bacterium]
MADERDEIRSRIDIVELVGQSVPLKKAGKSWKGLCPFHADKNPSFSVDPISGTYRCWSCGEHGDIFTWVMKTRHLEFFEALQFLAEQAGVTLTSRGPTTTKSDKVRWGAAMQDALDFFREQLAKSESALAYCTRRGLSPEVLSQWEIGYAPDVGEALASYLKRKGHSLAECKELFLVDEDSSGGYFDKFRGRLIFPIRNEGGDLIAFGGRLLGDGHPKYINSGDTPLYRKSRVLYGMNRAKDTLGREKRAVLVEGYLDVIACHQAGVKGALASLGTALTEDHARLLKRWCEQVVILYDSDAAGQKAADRAVEILREAGLRTRIALMPAGEDPDTLLKTAGPAAVQQAVETGLRPLDYRIRKLRASMSPDQDEFWVAAVEALATATNEMELEKFAGELAPLYPGSRGLHATQNALKADAIRLARQTRGQRLGQESSPGRPVGAGISEMHVLEIAILACLFDGPMRQPAWAACAEEGLFFTAAGVAAAAAVRLAYPEEPPVGKPATWLPYIEPESVREAIIAARSDSRLGPYSSGRDFSGFDLTACLQDALAGLRKLRRKRELQQRIGSPPDDKARKELLEKLKQRHSGDNPEA